MYGGVHHVLLGLSVVLVNDWHEWLPGDTITCPDRSRLGIVQLICMQSHTLVSSHTI